MGLNARKKLEEASKSIEKFNKSIEEIRTIENRKKSLQAQLVDSALSGGTEGTAGKEIIGLEKVIESMAEKLDREIPALGRSITELKPVYRERAVGTGIGKIAEAVPE